MEEWIGEREEGYYKKRENLGSEGDLIKEKEVRKMLGEMIGIWWIREWEEIERKENLVMWEIGKGRGKMMREMMRKIGRIEKKMMGGERIEMVEKRKRIEEKKKKKIEGKKENVEWFERFEDIKEDNVNGKMIIVKKEMLEEINLRKLVKEDGRFVERMIEINEKEELKFVRGEGGIDKEIMKKENVKEEEGEIFEEDKERKELMKEIERRIEEKRGDEIKID